MRILLQVLLGLVALGVTAAAAVLYYDAPSKPQRMTSISDPFKQVDVSDLPADQTYIARDGTKLGYKSYPAEGGKVVIMIHGSSDDGSGMHMLAKAFEATGVSVYVPVLRGHGGYGRTGDVDYKGQLDDDLADFMAMIDPEHPKADTTLLGFSSGGGFVFRVIGSPLEPLFNRFMLISPALSYDAPTTRPDAGGWVSVALPRSIVLAILNKMHITAFNGLPIIAFATSPDAKFLVSSYSYRMAENFGAPDDYLSRISKSSKPVALLVGGSDEVFYSDRFAPLLQPVRPDLKITIVPDVDHIGMSVAPKGVAAILQQFLAIGP